MPRTRHRAIDKLRTAIDCLPVDTRVAMLDGVRSNRIIVGAYVGADGGVCPMLAAHRNGGRTDFLSFAHAWDGFAASKRARRATVREVGVLVDHLEASLLAEQCEDFGGVIAEHRELVARRPRVRPEGRARVRPGDRDRSRELGGRDGWAWLRPVRRLDDYERALARVQAEQDAVDVAQPDRELSTV